MPLWLALAVLIICSMFSIFLFIRYRAKKTLKILILAVILALPAAAAVVYLAAGFLLIFNID